MANPHRGEVDLKAGDKTYQLRFSINAMCELEDEFGKGITEIAEMLNDEKQFRISTLRTLVWAAIDDDPKPSLKEVGDIITEAGIEQVGDAIGKAFAAAFPSEEASEGAANPRKRAGTGRRS